MQREVISVSYTAASIYKVLIFAIFLCFFLLNVFNFIYAN